MCVTDLQLSGAAMETTAGKVTAGNNSSCFNLCSSTVKCDLCVCFDDRVIFVPPLDLRGGLF